MNILWFFFIVFILWLIVFSWCAMILASRADDASERWYMRWKAEQNERNKNLTEKNEK